MASNIARVVPLTHNIGAEILDIDLCKPLTTETVEFIRTSLLEHQVIFFRDQPLTAEQHLALGQHFGPLHVHPAAPCVDGIPELMKIHTDGDSFRNNGDDWHSDVSCDEEPPLGSILRIHTIPPRGGDTLFSSMYAAYDALSDTMKDILDPLVGIHESEHIYTRSYGDAEVKRRNEYPSAEHPVIRTHPETGRKTIYVNSIFTTRIKGMSRAESDALLKFLFEHVRNPLFQCRFKWDVDSIAFWDNRAVQHHAIWDYFPETRSGVRVTVAGDKPFH